MKIELTPAVVACLKRGLNCWPQQNYAQGLEIKEILKNDETEKLRIAEDVRREWVGVTDKDISEIVRGTHNTGSFVRAIEAKLKDKNGG